jgi:hypothetical protein
MSCSIWTCCRSVLVNARDSCTKKIVHPCFRLLCAEFGTKTVTMVSIRDRWWMSGGEKQFKKCVAIKASSCHVWLFSSK